ncbi:putative peptide methionine sulfoxide reductase msrB [Cardiosporidium cionae]|uniref:Peptide methionine sulfoxide reductase msrB n=1 Tax=Cardiosporidium cionae TaxID=476202 RepID=A0ABQ7JBB6_9APIC|nr:putative peptide methionine sulfoxide reductase msrB [Cardiosporidium cionae]|eukprot:KAF8821287.1 putative peptide methionine sulfoxide reductase msrB [Cardiosporidium cionae]
MAFLLVRTLSVFVTMRFLRSLKMKSHENIFPTTFSVVKPENEWKKELSDLEYSVIRQQDTERAFSGKYDKFYPKKGHFVCRACRQPLYSAAAKFKSGCGAVVIRPDPSMGRLRNEIICAKCGGHLGHVFEGEKFTETDERHCVNSVSVVYVDQEVDTSSKETKVLP